MFDGHPWLARIERLWRNVVPLLALALALWAVIGLEGEAAERRDQNCLVFEQQHLTNVNRLEGTYRYLSTLPREDYGKPLTLAVLRGLTTQEAEARVDQSPAYCEEPNVGLPEDSKFDPKPPKKQDFSRLLEPPESDSSLPTRIDLCANQHSIIQLQRLFLKEHTAIREDLRQAEIRPRHNPGLLRRIAEAIEAGDCIPGGGR